MTNRIERLLKIVQNKEHHVFRQNIDESILESFPVSLKERGLSDIERSRERLHWVMENEKPVILPGERIVFLRTVKSIPEIFTKEEWKGIKEQNYIHELGKVCNISSDFEYTIQVGLEKRKSEVLESIDLQKSLSNDSNVLFLEAVLQSIEDILQLSHRYAIKALENGREDIYDMLQKVPRNGASNFHEALQFFRILHFTLWASGNYHNTIGRFDQYMFKYLRNDLQNGDLDYDSAFELLEEFFLSFNRDSDLYPGMLQGDNGQSMVLGGVNEKGKPCFNELSEMCLKASLELNLIDPKINLRVNKDTPFEIFALSTELTKQGLGFPQYSNDDIVIPGLVEKGYSLKDARNYVVAACWEFIIPGEGMDIPNIDALSFAKVINTALRKFLVDSDDFEQFLTKVRVVLEEELELIINRHKNLYMEPAPFQSLLMRNCINNGQDISLGAKYNNYGIHGTGISTAIDSLAAIKKFVFDEKIFTKEAIIVGIESNFEHQEEMWRKLRYDAPKMGNDDDYVDGIAVRVLDFFADLVEGLENERGGCYRPGSGSAMYYLWHVDDLNASADGRKKGEPLSANFSPGLNAKLDGPVSIIRSFSKPNMKKIINGGPLTIELHDTVFRNTESIKKVASLVKAYIDMGGHQLQLNAVNRDQLIDAKKNPEKHRNLIVRVWGWSGYFTELEEVYQDHIIQRVELSM